jgi:single-stranded DNA-binding protein
MNHLNSILIEGSLITDPVFDEETGTYSFIIQNQICFKEKEKIKKEYVTMEIRTIGRLAKNCFQYLKKERVVRIVGRLKQESVIVFMAQLSHVITHVFAEHVEFKPE